MWPTIERKGKLQTFSRGSRYVGEATLIGLINSLGEMDGFPLRFVQYSLNLSEARGSRFYCSNINVYLFQR